MTAERRAFSVAVYARYRGKVLLIHHKRLGKWLPIGGEIEEGESPIEAAIRELREETALEGTFDSDPGIDGTPKGYLGYEEHTAGTKGRHLNFAFVADVATDEIKSNGEYDEHRWVDAAQLGEIECPVNVWELGMLALAAGARGPATLATVELEAIARRWLSAFNGRDLDRLLALYADDAVHTSPKLRVRNPESKGLVSGKAALRAWWADSFMRLPGLFYEETSLTASRDRVFMEYRRVNPGEEPLLVAEVLVIRDGRIVESKVFHG